MSVWLSALGLCLAAATLARVLSLLAPYLLKTRKFAPGTYAVVTGATDGIGRAYCFALASQTELNLMVIGRSEDKLKELKAKLLEVRKGIEVRTVVTDFKTRDLTAVKAAIAELPAVSLLLNNVGVSYPGALPFEDVDFDFVDELVDVNLRSAMQLTRAVLPQMKSARNGAIICIGSGVAAVAEPYLAGYCAAKGGVEAFCRSLQVECREQNVLVQCQTPMFVATKMAKIRNANLLVPTPHDFAQFGLRFIMGSTLRGIFATPTVVSPYPSHSLIMELLRFVPSTLLQRQRLWEQKRLNKRYRAKLQSKAN